MAEHSALNREVVGSTPIRRTRMTHFVVHVFGMELERWEHESCIADFGVGPDWATLYDIQSRQPGQGHATALLTEAKSFYESAGKTFGGSVALNDRMREIYHRLGIEEYDT